MPVAHFGIGTSDIATLSKFYEAALAPLGYKIKSSHENGKLLGFSDDIGTGGPSFWIADDSIRPERVQVHLRDGAKHVPVHFALECATREQVDGFYEAAIAAGGKCNGPPGMKPYGAYYYAAFVLDLEGNNVEAVYNGPGKTGSEVEGSNV